MGVWEVLHPLFDTDDGSLPEVRVTNLTTEGVVAVFDLIRSRGSLNPDAKLWHRTLNQAVDLKSYPNAARLVATGEAEAFHVLATGISLDGVIIPDLGIFVFPDVIQMDYRMGPEWNELKVLTFFGLLRQMVALDPIAVVSLDQHVLPAVEKKFLAVWSEYCRSSAT